jgi:hypothetical protein
MKRISDEQINQAQLLTPEDNDATNQEYLDGGGAFGKGNVTNEMHDLFNEILSQHVGRKVADAQLAADREWIRNNCTLVSPDKDSLTRFEPYYILPQKELEVSSDVRSLLDMPHAGQ